MDDSELAMALPYLKVRCNEGDVHQLVSFD